MVSKKLKKFIKSPIRFFKDFYLKRFRLKGAHDYDVYAQLQRFIDDYEVNSLKFDEEYLWPYLRNHIWAAINSISLGQYQDYQLKPYRIQGGHPSQLPPHLYSLLEKKYRAITSRNMPEGKTDILFFVMQNAVEQQQIGDKIYHKVVDPYYEQAKHITSAEKIEIIRTKNLSFRWNDYKHPAKLLLLPQDIQSRKTIMKPLLYDDCIFQKIREHIKLLKPLTPQVLHDLVGYELAVRAYYLEVLKAIQPKIICLNYFHRYAPLISAADELGIITVDLQHGLQAGWGVLYNHYPEVKGISYQALPNYFAVWSENEAKHIRQTFNSDKKHKPIIMGNAWLHRQKCMQSELPKYLQSKVDSNQPVVLVILQKQLSVPMWLKQLMASSEEVVWLVRHHPKGKQFKIEDFIDGKNNIVINQEIDEALPTELSRVDLTISEGSALSMEMRFLGVPGVIIGKKGKQSYQSAIEKGWLLYFEQPPKNISTILNMAKTQCVTDVKFFDEVSPKAFIKKLMVLSQGKEPYET